MDSWLGGQLIAVAPSGTVYASDLTKLYALTPDGDLLWVATLAGGRRPISVAADGTIYAAGNLIKAFSPDGVLKWQFANQDPGSEFLAGPNVGSNGNIYAVQDTDLAPAADGFVGLASTLTVELGQRRRSAADPNAVETVPS